jgi:hypothetical protein
MLNDTALMGALLGGAGWLMIYANHGDQKIRFIGLAMISLGFYVAGHFGELPAMIASAVAGMSGAAR